MGIHSSLDTRPGCFPTKNDDDDDDKDPSMRDAFTPSLLRDLGIRLGFCSLLFVAVLFLDCFREGRFARKSFADTLDLRRITSQFLVDLVVPPLLLIPEDHRLNIEFNPVLFELCPVHQSVMVSARHPVHPI